MKIVNLVKTALLTALTVLSVNAIAAEGDSIESRLMPAGNVCVDGVECETAKAVAAPKVDENSPEALFKGRCNACHGTGVGGAPVVGDAAQWAPRIAKGIDALYASGINGLPGTLMAAKGGAGDLSDEQVTSIVDYMVEQSQ